jgi:hypothetical protein
MSKLSPAPMWASEAWLQRAAWVQAAFPGYHGDATTVGRSPDPGGVSSIPVELEEAAVLPAPLPYFSAERRTRICTELALACDRYTRWVAFTKSVAFASKMLGTNVWGLRSMSGNQLD